MKRRGSLYTFNFEASRSKLNSKIEPRLAVLDKSHIAVKLPRLSEGDLRRGYTSDTACVPCTCQVSLCFFEDVK